MKKLNKLSINPEKVIKNEELTNLRGGYDVGDPYGPCPEGRSRYSCCCVGSVGSWTGCYTSKSSAESDGADWCESGRARCS